MSKANNQVAVIVVNYGTADLAITAVESVLSRAHAGCDVAVHLVDNASPNGDAVTLQQAYHTCSWEGRVHLWLETENHGFGRGNNVVLRALAQQEAPPDKVLLLNPDARLENEVIAILAATLDDYPKVAAVGASVLRPDLTPVTAAFRFPNPRNELSRVVQLGLVDRFFERKLVALPPQHPAGPVDWVSGACVMFQFSAIQEVGFFDPAFFLYYEEVDMMRRLHAAGWQIFYAPHACVVHEEGAATGQFAGSRGRKRDPDYLYLSWRHYFVQAYGRVGALMIALMLWPAACLHLVHRGLRGKPPTIPRHFFLDHWRYVLRPLLFAGRS